MNNETVNVAAKISILETETGHKISLDDVCLNLNREQYDRLLTSYNTKKLKIMNDDENITDICGLFLEYYGSEDLDLEDDQKLIVGYPVEITSGLSFDALIKTAGNEVKDKKVSGGYKSDWLPEGRIVFNDNYDRKIEFGDGNVAFCSDDKDTYTCKVTWLGREIELKIYSCEEDPDAQAESIKKTYERFLANRNDYLKMCQHDVVEMLLPYIAEHESVSELRITADDFYADYSLTDIYFATGDDMDMDEMQITFKSDNGEDMICVHRDLENGSIMDFFDGSNELYPDDWDK